MLLLLSLLFDVTSTAAADVTAAGITVAAVVVVVAHTADETAGRAADVQFHCSMFRCCC